MTNEQLDRAKDALKGSKAFVLVTFDGEGFPECSYDVSDCLNEKDIRHAVMQEVAGTVQGIWESAQEALERKKVTLERDEAVYLDIKKSEEPITTQDVAKVLDNDTTESYNQENV